MERRCRAGLGFGVLVLAMASFAVACDDDDGPAVTPTSGTAATAARATPTAVAIEASPAAPGPATFPVLAGRSDGPIDVERFMPADIRVRQGDSVAWTALGIEGHTITFAEPDYLSSVGGYLVPDPQDPAQSIFNPDISLRIGDDSVNRGEVVSSGFIGIPAEATYTLMFPETGVFEYVCLTHPFTMRGSVSVDAPEAQVDSPESVAARGEAERDGYLASHEQRADDAAARQHSFPSTGGTSLHKVDVGLTTPDGQIAVFTPGSLDIGVGDTVIFENDDRNFHNVIFRGSLPEPPPAYDIYPDPGGRGILVALAAESANPVEPQGAFGPETFLSSGTMGPLQTRLTWRLTFTQPGRYIYNCTIHSFSGMSGVITVTP